MSGFRDAELGQNQPELAQTQELREVLTFINSSNQTLREAERTAKRANSENSIAMSKLAEHTVRDGSEFVVELSYDDPDFSAELWEYDDELLDEHPTTFNATEVLRHNNGETWFINRSNGQILKTHGGYPYRLRTVESVEREKTTSTEYIVQCRDIFASALKRRAAGQLRHFGYKGEVLDRFMEPIVVKYDSMDLEALEVEWYKDHKKPPFQLGIIDTIRKAE